LEKLFHLCRKLISIQTIYLNFIMMKKYLSFFVVIFCAVFVACNSAIEGAEPLPVEETDLFVQSEYNLDLRDFALAVSSAMNQSTEFRQLIKGQALAKFDGDYDVLLRHIKDKPLAPVDDALLRSGGSYTVKDLLEHSYAPNELRSAASIMEELSERYPNLQVSIPVHAEDWDESTVPVVAFIPYEYEDFVTQTVAGYTSDGRLISIDAIVPPDGPVIVVGQNERGFEILDPVLFPPARPTNVTATQAPSGIALQWDANSDNSVLGYKIYRKGASDSDFSLLMTNNGRVNSVANDVDITTGATYWYYVTAYNISGESLPSTTASAVGPNRPGGPTSFSADVITNQDVELRWTTEPDTYIESIELSRHILNQSSSYQLYQQFGSNQYDYFDQNVTKGSTIRYKLQIINPVGASNPMYDMVKIPYRNPAEKSPVHIKHIKCSHDLEGWLRGDPEILISVYSVDGANNTIEIANRMLGVGGCDSNFDELLFEWKPNAWYDNHTFHAVELDGDENGKSIKISAKIGVKYKLADSVELGFELGMERSFTFNGPEDCGGADLSFYDPINTTLLFRGKEAKLWCDVTLGQ
jgi:hypothetical protein